MKERWILGVRVADRQAATDSVQTVLTRFGCTIRTRLGLHDGGGVRGATGGLILLELTGDQNEFHKLENELLALDGVDVRKMVFDE